jgi:phospholipase C
METKALLTLIVAGSLVACSAASDQGDDASNGGGTQASAWDAESADNEAESTHLWIVDRAIDILARHADSDDVAATAVRVLNDSTCRERWQQGLLDADFKAAYNNGRQDMPLNPNDLQVAAAGATWESHFYDADTGKNYKGETRPTAKTEAESHLGMALENHLGGAIANRSACYELGLTLHYFTDLTQPMHAANFTAVDRPAKLHSNLEGYSKEIQDRFPLADWTEQPSGEIPAFIVATARNSKKMFGEGVTAVVNAYRRNELQHGLLCRDIDADPWRFIERQHLDYKECWAGDPEVDAMVGRTLKVAQDKTAQFIYLVAGKMDGT